MDYLLKIKNESKAKALLNMLKTIDYIEIARHDSNKEVRDMIKASEKSKSIPFLKALSISEEWKRYPRFYKS